MQHESEGFLNYLSGKKSICTFGLGKKIVLFNNEKHLLGKDQNIAFVWLLNPFLDLQIQSAS